MGAAREIRLALVANPALPHGYLQLAEYELGSERPDSAYSALEQASAHGEPQAMVARFALAKGDALYKGATASKRREDFATARRFLALAQPLDPSPPAAFLLLGASALSVGAVGRERCAGRQELRFVTPREGAASLQGRPKQNLTSGESVAPDAAKQYLEYLNQPATVCRGPGVKAFCTSN